MRQLVVKLTYKNALSASIFKMIERFLKYVFKINNIFVVCCITLAMEYMPHPTIATKIYKLDVSATDTSVY